MYIELTAIEIKEMNNCMNIAETMAMMSHFHI